MDKIKKAIESLESKDDSYFATEEGKKILSSISLLKNELKKHDFINNKSCEHDLEDICSYAENNLTSEEYERVDTLISSCDSCFETYYEIKQKYETILKTPERLKDRVEDKQVEDEKEIPKSLFTSVLKKLKTNFTYTGSGVLVGFATAVFMFLIILPNKQNISINTNNNGVVFNSVTSSLDNQLFIEAMEEKQKGHLEVAIEKLELFLEKNPSSLEADFELAKLYKAQKKFKSAKRHFEVYLKKANNLKLELEKNITEATNEINN